MNIVLSRDKERRQTFTLFGIGDSLRLFTTLSTSYAGCAHWLGLASGFKGRGFSADR
jgi:hypothetical protein